MKHWLIAFALALSVGCTFDASCGGKKTLNMENLRTYISGTFERQGAMPDAIDCPEKVPIKEGHTVNCKVTVGGMKVTVEVVQTSDDGDVDMKMLDDLISARNVEQLLVQRIKEASGSDVKVKCAGPQFRKTVVGDTFACEATGSDGDTARFRATVTDQSGTVQLEKIAEPRAAPAN